MEIMIQAEAAVEVRTFAAKLANVGSDVQAAFLNSFLQELKARCKTQYKLDLQCLYIRDHLHDDTKAALRTLSEGPSAILPDRRPCDADDR